MDSSGKSEARKKANEKSFTRKAVHIPILVIVSAGDSIFGSYLIDRREAIEWAVCGVCPKWDNFALPPKEATQ